MNPLARFAQLVQAPEQDLPLDEAALLVATCVRPVDVHAGLARLDDLASGCRGRDATGVSEYLFLESGFAGDTVDYDDPRNSFLDDVMARRLGIPISLSVLMIEVARRVDVTLRGIGMPGHFLVRDERRPDRYFDPFHGGASIDAAGAEALFHAVRGEERFRPEYLDPIGRRATLSRMLANLQRSFLRRQAGAVAPVARMRLAIPGLPVTERYHLATLLGSIGQYDEAAALLEGLADKLGDADAARVRQQVVAFRARGN
ncbi:MAG: transglutaminase family protein [Actinobacteria bacterium]|nr:transglutaminase family protein [Actinomycetota bacterium]